MKKSTNRTIKNVIMCLLIAVLCVGSYFTMDYAKDNIQSSGFEMQMPSGEMPQGAPGSSSDSDSSNQPPEMPSGDSNSNAQPSSPPESSDSNSDDSSNQPPEMPSGDSNSNAQPSSPPESSDSNSGDSSNQPPSMPNGEMHQGAPGSSKKLTTVYYIIFACEGLLISLLLIYLIMSQFNKKSFKETFKNGKSIIAFALALIIATSGLTVAQSAVASKFFLSSSSSSQSFDMKNQNSESADASGATTVDSGEQSLTETYSSTTSDESAILVTNGGSATVDGATITKSGDSSNTENSEFYGVNAGVLVQANSSATIKNANISTDAKGANAVFSTGENSKIYISDSTITTTGESSARGLDATYGGYIEADNVKITTQGGSCAALATDRGEGTVIAKNSTLETNGKGSPVIYSTGDISIENTNGTANGSQMVVIEGKNSATVTNSTLTATGAGNRGDVDVAGIMIYQSMSGDASEGTGTLTAENSSLSVATTSNYYKSAPMFFITNTDAVINLTNTKLSFGSGILLNAAGTSEWGKEGSNGGNVTLNATSQTLNGNIVADKISTVAINLTKSTYEGTINGDNSAKEVSLKLDKDSKITLTGDSYVTSLENADTSNSNIDFNGYTLYVNGKAIN
jgi:hypothetical protein